MFFKRIYCRCFQFCLKVALPFLPYKDPIILNKTSDILEVLKNENKNNVLIVTDNILFDLGLLNNLLEVLNNKNVFIYKDTVANPTSDNVLDALRMYKDNNCDIIVALGGGSVIDLAKALGALVARPKKTLAQMAGILHVGKKIPTLIAIPTTAGTGSETTLASVIVDSESRHKYAINDFPLIPKYALLDETLLKDLPKSIISTTGMDALTHAIEAYIGRGGNKKTRNDSLMAIKLIFENLLNAYNSNDLIYKKNMLYASHLAGRAFSKAYVGNIHSIAHSLGGKYNTPHGLANAIILPKVLRKYGNKIDKKMYEIAKYLNIETSKDEASNLIIEKIEEMNKLMNIKNNLEINDSDILELAKYAYKESNPLYPVPVIWSIDEFVSFYKELKNGN